MFFTISKLAWLIIRPETWIIIGITATCFALFTKRTQFARLAGFVTIFLVLAIAIFPLGALLMRPLENSYTGISRPDNIHGIVVLDGDFLERSVPAIMLAMRHPSARLLYTGMSEPTFVKRFFSSFGLSSERIIVEPKARNTIENARFSYQKAAPTPNETWLLVTSAYHMPRALATFKTAGWKNIVPYPTGYKSLNLSQGIGWNLARNLDELNSAIKEYLGITVYWMFGYI